MTSESMVEDSPKWSFAASEIQKFDFGNWAFSSFFEWKLSSCQKVQNPLDGWEKPHCEHQDSHCFSFFWVGCTLHSDGPNWCIANWSTHLWKWRVHWMTHFSLVSFSKNCVQSQTSQCLQWGHDSWNVVQIAILTDSTSEDVKRIASSHTFLDCNTDVDQTVITSPNEHCFYRCSICNAFSVPLKQSGFIDCVLDTNHPAKCKRLKSHTCVCVQLAHACCAKPTKKCKKPNHPKMLQMHYQPFWDLFSCLRWPHAQSLHHWGWHCHFPESMEECPIPVSQQTGEKPSPLGPGFQSDCCSWMTIWSLQTQALPFKVQEK